MQLSQLTGVAAILRYPASHLEELDDDNDNDDESENDDAKSKGDGE